MGTCTEIILGDGSFGRAFLPEVSQQPLHPGQSLFTGVEKLVNQITSAPSIPDTRAILVAIFGRKGIENCPECSLLTSLFLGWYL
jgi:hypothetical protein